MKRADEMEGLIFGKRFQKNPSHSKIIFMSHGYELTHHDCNWL